MNRHSLLTNVTVTVVSLSVAAAPVLAADRIKVVLRLQPQTSKHRLQLRVVFLNAPLGLAEKYRELP